MSLRTHRLFIALMAWRFMAVPLLLGGIFARVHDNLDSGLVYHVLGARFWAGGMDHAVLDLHLNGVLDWTYFAGLTWPIQLTYVLFAPATAYFVTELLVVVTGYISMYVLLCDIARHDGANRATEGDPARSAALMACLFAMTLGFSTLGLGVAAAPLVVFLAWRPVSFASVAGLFLVGWNSGLVGHAIFLPVVVFVLSAALGRGFRGTLVPLAVYISGAVLGALPLFAQVLGGEVTHRSLWPTTATLPDAAEVAGKLAAALVGQMPWYHATVTPALYSAVFLIAGLVVRRRAGVMVACILLGAVAIDLLAPWQGRVLPGVLASLQFDRIGQFAAFLLITLGALVLFAAPAGRAARWVRAAAVLTLVQAMLIWSGVNGATLRAAFPPEDRALLRAEARQNGLAFALERANLSLHRLAAAIPTVQRHMRSQDYACIAQVVGNRRVASAGPDPMLAPLHRMAATDGYHYLYPAHWHTAFRPVIAAKLDASAELRAYYDDWGSRVGLFIDRVPEISPDFDALHALGTSYVIADRPLPLEQVKIPCALSDGLRLYRLGP